MYLITNFQLANLLIDQELLWRCYWIILLDSVYIVYCTLYESWSLGGKWFSSLWNLHAPTYQMLFMDHQYLCTSRSLMPRKRYLSYELHQVLEGQLKEIQSFQTLGTSALEFRDLSLKVWLCVHLSRSCITMDYLNGFAVFAPTVLVRPF